MKLLVYFEGWAEMDVKTPMSNSELIEKLQNGTICLSIFDEDMINEDGDWMKESKAELEDYNIHYFEFQELIDDKIVKR